MMKYLIAVILVILATAYFYISRQAPQLTTPVPEAVSPVQTAFASGHTKVDEILARDFVRDLSDYSVLVKSSGSHPDQRMPLKDFVIQIHKDLGCPHCQVDFECQDREGHANSDCILEWSREEEAPIDNQDMEAGSIWTLHYQRDKGSRPAALIDSLTATWRDF